MAHHCPSAQKRAMAVDRELRGYMVNGTIPMDLLPKASKAASRKVNYLWTAQDCRLYAYQNRLVDRSQYLAIYN